MDLATSHTVTLLDSSVHLLSTNVKGPLPPDTQALLIGRSSTTLSGLFVLPGVIDSDSVDEIKIMAWTPFPPCTIPQGSRIAQLILIPAGVSSLTTDHPLQRRGGFGSTGLPHILWVQSISPQRPMHQCTLIYNDQQIALNGIIDTGADVTVISQAKWPPQWPLTNVSQTLAGIGGTGNSRQSLELIRIQGPEGHVASVKPFVLPVPMVLWGCDILSQSGMSIRTHF